jgi:peptide/nickel transport system ATP-binding protein
MTSLIEVQNLRVGFRMGKETFEAVRGVSFDIPANTTVALVGESGSGKSVSAMSIVRLLPPNAVVDPGSRVLYNGVDLLQLPQEDMRRLRGKEMSVIFQEPMSSLNPVLTVGDQIAEVLRVHTPMSGRAVQDRTLELLNEVGIPEPRARLNAYPHELSGGQQQRVMIAMAIACEPKLLIADEAQAADRRRADDGAGCHGAAADRRPARAHAGAPQDEHAVHQPRSRTGGRSGQPCDRDAAGRSA